MDKKFKRVAVCIGSHMRIYKETAEIFQERFLKNIAEEWDFFIYTTGRIDHRYPKPDSRQPPMMSDEDIQEIIKLYKPKKIVIDGVDFNNPGSAQRDNGPKRNRMLYRSKLSNALRHEYEKEAGVEYDCVIKMRPDQIVLEEFTGLDKIDPHRLGLWPYGRVHDGVTDTFAMGPPHLMDIYFNLADNMEKYEYLGHNGDCRIELVVQQYLIDEEIDYYDVPVNLLIKRINGDEFWFHDQPGAAEWFAKERGWKWDTNLRKFIDIG